MKNEQKETPKEVTAEEAYDTFDNGINEFQGNYMFKVDVVALMKSFAQPLREEIERMKGCLYERGQTIQELDADTERLKRENKRLDEMIDDLRGKYFSQDVYQHNTPDCKWDAEDLHVIKGVAFKKMLDDLDVNHNADTHSFYAGWDAGAKHSKSSKQHQEWPTDQEKYTKQRIKADEMTKNGFKDSSIANYSLGFEDCLDWLKDWKGKGGTEI